MADCPGATRRQILVSVINPDGTDPRAMSPPPAFRRPPASRR
jgi:hypothetical protein